MCVPFCLCLCCTMQALQQGGTSFKEPAGCVQIRIVNLEVGDDGLYWLVAPCRQVKGRPLTPVQI